MKSLADHILVKNTMNPKLADIAVNLGHLNAAALKDLVDFIRSGETTENMSEEVSTEETETAETTETPAESQAE